MGPYFIAFLNKAGIVCASGTDNTIFKLSNEEAFAIAINPESVFPWKRVIEEYISKGEPVHHDCFEEYVRDFEKFLQQKDSDGCFDDIHDSLEGNPEDTAIFLGYGGHDIFPSVIKADLEYDESLSLSWEWSEDESALLHNCSGKIGHTTKAGICTLGEFNYIEPVLFGIADKNEGIINEKLCFHLGKDLSVKEQNRLCETISSLRAGSDIKSSLAEGVETFSIENMVSAAETIINSNLQLEHLSSLSNSEPGTTKEIAVLQHPEGLSWCLHSFMKI